ncbi:MAG: thiol-activated cytolysin C-terminal domain-containing protein, partial [Paeniclostridium sordellii]|nr:thiol-activated cytolysin C-terminal domain-containing protein [Paeniclostridium sordellii]
RTIIDEKNVPLAPNVNVSIWGTTLYPRTSIDYQTN